MGFGFGFGVRSVTVALVCVSAGGEESMRIPIFSEDKAYGTYSFIGEGFIMTNSLIFFYF